MYRRIGFSILLLLAVGLTACSGTGVRMEGRTIPVSPDTILDLKADRSLTEAELAARLAEKQVVFIGEIHDHPEQHHRQLRLIQALAKRWGNMAVGLELFERSRQTLLDDWLADRIPVEVLDQGGRDAMGPAAWKVYRPLVLWAREAGVPLVALNAPRKITARVAEKGLEGLTPEERRSIAAAIVLGPKAYMVRVAKAFKHHMRRTDPGNFFKAQVIWDETMAESAAWYLASPEGKGRHMVIIAGNEHVMYGHGIPDRLARRMPGVTMGLLIAPVSTEDLILSPEIADYAWMSAPAPETDRPRLGIVIERDADGNTRIKSVEPGSPADKCGLKAGDRVLEMDGKPITSLMDLHKAAVEGGVEAEHVLTVERGGQTLSMPFRFGR